MTAVLRDLPFLEVADEVMVGRERVPLKAYQIIVWVSLSPSEVLELPPRAHRFPAILDTGHGHNCSIQDRQLTDWASLDLRVLPARGRLREGGRYVPVHAANLWLHANVAGTRDDLSDSPPCLVRLDRGIAVYPGQGGYPRLPLVGLRTLVRNGLYLSLDPERCVVNLRTLDWKTKLLRWLR
jgi:hypothetical protein